MFRKILDKNINKGVLEMEKPVVEVDTTMSQDCHVQR